MFCMIFEEKYLLCYRLLTEQPVRNVFGSRQLCAKNIGKTTQVKKKL